VTSLEAELLENPDDESLRLVLADKLVAAGDPRGELIVVQSKRARGDDSDDLVAREKELLALFRHDVPDGVTATWQLGFVRTAWVTGDHFVVAKLLASDSLRYLRELWIEIEDNEPDHGIRFTTRVLGELADAVRPTIAALTIKRRHFDDNYPFEISDRAYDSRDLWTKLPALRELALDGVDIVSTLDHPRLEMLLLDDRPIDPGATWNTPSLRCIDWYCYWESSGVGVDSQGETFDPLWRQELPALRELSLRASIIDPIAPVTRPDIASFVRRLDRLRVSLSMFGDIATLNASADHLAHLSKLVLLDADASDRDPADPRLAIEIDDGRTRRRGRGAIP
jgi:uncharacterized protein (TIGR02996 family)